nr:hypothetical protein [uncultured Oscillibacter sp.]
MENNVFKSVAFGGFDKQDVVSYIERTAREASEAQEKLQQENDGLRRESQALGEEAAALRSKLEAQEAENARLREALARETALRQELEALRPETERLREQVESMREDAESYARFRGQIGAIECEARQRAAGLEDEAGARMRHLAEAFQSQYRTLMSTFETTAAHVNSELRKIEVNLTQLPRAMDRSGAELKELEALLERREKED